MPGPTPVPNLILWVRDRVPAGQPHLWDGCRPAMHLHRERAHLSPAATAEKSHRTCSARQRLRAAGHFADSPRRGSKPRSRQCRPRVAWPGSADQLLWRSHDRENAHSRRPATPANQRPPRCAYAQTLPRPRRPEECGSARAAVPSASAWPMRRRPDESDGSAENYALSSSVFLSRRLRIPSSWLPFAYGLACSPAYRRWAHLPCVSRRVPPRALGLVPRQADFEPRTTGLLPNQIANARKPANTRVHMPAREKNRLCANAPPRLLIIAENYCPGEKHRPRRDFE